MHEISTESIGFYAAVWAMAFCACLCRSYRDAVSVNFWNICAGCGMAGFLAFGLIGFLVDGVRGPDGNSVHTRWFFLAVAALVGLVSKDPDKLAMMIINKVLGAIRMAISKDDSEDK